MLLQGFHREGMTGPFQGARGSGPGGCDRGDQRDLVLASSSADIGAIGSWPAPPGCVDYEVHLPGTDQLYRVNRVNRVPSTRRSVEPSLRRRHLGHQCLHRDPGLFQVLRRPGGGRDREACGHKAGGCLQAGGLVAVGHGEKDGTAL